jgi:peptide/nickel transport system substrate-binding protein
VRGFKRSTLQVGAGFAALALVAAACGGGGGKSSTGGSGGGATSGLGLQIYANNSSGTPKTGGTLTMLGTGDVDNDLDPNYSYYTVDYMAMRMYERQLYSPPDIQGQTFNLVPDAAAALPKITNGGLDYAVTLRKGVMWNTTPPRQVTAADEVLAVKRSCNPTAPFAGQPDFADVLAGYASFCQAFSSVSATSASAQAAFINSHNISGVTVDPSDKSGLTVDFTLLKPANYFTGALSLGAFDPVPSEYLNYLPVSTALSEHILSDGPYEVKSYSPGKSIVFVRNPVWQASTDPLRKAYVNEVDVSETGNEQGIYQQILTNSPAADMMWDTHVPPSAVPGLIASKNPGFFLETESATNPYIIFNTISKNNGGALQNVAVRQAISYAISRTQLNQNAGGPDVSPPLTHILAPGTNGSSPNFDDYPYNPTKAKAMLAAAGVTHLTLKYLYRPASISSAKDFQTVQSNLAAIGVTVTPVSATNSDFYAKDLTPGTLAKNSGWDLAEAGWGPDWYPTGQKSYFLPILDGSNLPPNSSNFGFFNDPKADALYAQALTAPTDAAATALWHAADVEVMAQAALYPVSDPNEADLHGTQVHNCVFVAVWQNCDPTNIWLSS